MNANDALPVRIEDILKHRAWVSALARSLVRDDSTAEDLVQDTFTTALTRPPLRRGSLRAWLSTVLRNRLRDRLRTESRRIRREALAARRGAVPSAADLASAADAHRKLMQAVMELTEPYREAVLLRYHEGLSVIEVAERQRVPPSTARTRLQRARDRLRERLDSDHGGAGSNWSLALVPLLATTTGSALPHPAGAFGTLRGLLMAHKMKLAASGLLALVAASVLISITGPNDPAPVWAADEVPIPAGAVPAEPAPDDDPIARGADTDEPRAAFRLPGSTRTDAVSLPIAGCFTMEIGERGVVTVGDVDASLKGEGGDRLKRLVESLADAQRDTEHPMMPSLRAALIHADALTPWRTIRDAMRIPANPHSRIYRIYWAACRGNTAIGLPVFLPLDSGPTRTKVHLLQPLAVRVTLVHASGATGTSVQLLDLALGEDEAGLDALARRLPALLKGAPQIPVVIAADGEVPFEHVIRALDLVPTPNAWHLADFRPSTRVSLAGSAGAGPTSGTLEQLERAMVPTKEDLPRVRELLKESVHTRGSLAELLGKTRISRALALWLGRAYLERGTPDDSLRALTLGTLITAADQTIRYGTDWWNGELLALRALLLFAKAGESAKACDLGLSRCRDYAALGLLDRSPLRAEIMRIRSDLEELSGK